MRHLTEDFKEMAEGFAKEHNNDMVSSFDFSLFSLQIVDDYMNALGQENPDEDTLHQISVVVGSYVFEVAKRNFGGDYQWVEKENAPVLIYQSGGSTLTLYTWNKVRERIVKGVNYSLFDHVEGFSHQVERIKEGNTVNMVLN